MANRRGWIGVDLDGTLAVYDGWKGITHIGEPVELMLTRVKAWVGLGHEVRIFTARVACDEPQRTQVIRYINHWCKTHGLPELEVTCVKDMSMIALWDDRAIQVVPNTGLRVDGGK